MNKLWFDVTVAALLLVTAAAPADVRDVQIENNRWITVDGQKFFPIYVWSPPPTMDWLTYFNGLGINTAMNNGWQPEYNGMMLDNAQALGMYSILKFDAGQVNHPALLTWMADDEPDIYGVPPEELEAQFDYIRSVDPNHLIVTNLSCGFYYDENFDFIPAALNGSREWYYQYAAVTDLLSFDFYPVTGWNRPDWVYIPGPATEMLFNEYANSQKPVWAIVEASDADLSWTPPETRGPTPEEMRFEVWHAVIHGATGIGYFTIAFNPFRWANIDQAIEAEMTRTNGQLTALTEVILSMPPDLSLTVSEASGQTCNYMVRRSGNTYYLLVDNADMARQAATITATFDRQLGSVSVYDESRQIIPDGNSFTDSFAPLEVHIYEIAFDCHGDLDADAQVGQSDLAILLGNYGTGTGMSYEDGDLSGDGDVDLSDLAELLSIYGTICQ